MKNLLFLTLASMVMACADPKANTSKEEQPENTGHIAYEQVFKEVDSLLRAGGKEFWKAPLYGPILLVDPETRVFVSNRNNARGSFLKVGEVYTDTLPQEVTLANTAVTWEGEKWTMVMTPLPADTADRNNLIIHELFHRVQDTIGFRNLTEAANNHLDTYKGRLLLKLELRALEEALRATDRETVRTHLANALQFRHSRHTSFDAGTSENALEINEGLAEFTGAMLSGRKDEAMLSHLIGNIKGFYGNKTFVRSFAYQTIPAYGYLLWKEQPNWQWDVDRETHLTDYFQKAFAITPTPEADPAELARAHNYGYETIEEEEMEREYQRLSQLAEYKKTFLESPVLEITFRHMNISFDPRNITPLESHGTVYPTMKVTDDWGILTVEKGALLSADWSGVRVSKPLKISPEMVEGDGWKLELNPGWMVKERNSRFSLDPM